jgi:hypothetical protein
MTLQTLVVPIEWKADDKDAGVMVGYASTFGNVDLGGDVVMPGAFDKSIADIKADGIPLLADHLAATSHVLGTIYDALADDKGLKIWARLSKAPSAVDTTTKMREGHLGKLSIGYETMDDSFEDRDGMRVRLLNDVKLWETSVVVFPMNPKAAITGVKSLLGAMVAGGVGTPEEFAAEAKAEHVKAAAGGEGLSTLDAWRIEYAVETKTGVPSSQPAPAEPGRASAGPTSTEAPPSGEVKSTPTDAGDQPTKWDRLKSEALLADRPTGEIDATTRAALKTSLELAESQLPRD